MSHGREFGRVNRIRTALLGLPTLLIVFLANLAAAQGTTCISPTLDTDNDGIPDAQDNCILVANANQRDTSGSGIGNACNPDLNHDGIVNFLDLSLLKVAYNNYNSAAHTYDPNADFNGDGKIDAADVAILESYLGKAPGPSAAFPAISVTPTTVNFGTPFVGVPTPMAVTVTNSGCRPVQVLSATLTGDASFTLYTPTSLTLANAGQTASINVGFTPASTATVTATLTIVTNAGGGAGQTFVIPLSGSGVNPTPVQTPTLVAPTSIAPTTVATGGTTTQSLTLSNTGSAPLVITGITSSNSAFSVDPTVLGGFPITLAPGTSESVPVKVTAGSQTGLITGSFQIQSNDKSASSAPISLQTLVVTPPAVPNNPVTMAQAFDGQTPITAANCSSVTRAITFGPGTNSGDQYQVVLKNAAGKSISSAFFPVPTSPGTQVLSGVNVCPLGDGPISVSVVYSAAGGTAPVFAGTPATQDTSPALAPPTLTPPSVPYFTTSTANICGTSRANTTVVINGGTAPVSATLDAATTTFCLNVPLVPNQQNTLVATAVDDLAAAPRPSESSIPLLVTQINPSQIVIASATTTPLTVAQVQTLVQNGIINLQDPSNFNVSIFTIVLTIGSFPVTVTQPVVIPNNPATPLPPQVYNGISSGSTGGSGGSSSSGATPCTSLCTIVVPIRPPSGPVIPGILIIDGTIKTLKEFFQVTLAIQNTSSVFTLTNVASSLTLPAGDLTAVSAGVGTNVGTLTANAASSISLGSIAPGATGSGQFIIRGDAIGNYGLAVQYNGFITGGGLSSNLPFSGSANTSVQVLGPPALSVAVQFPKTGSSYDVVAGQQFPLTVNITNTSSQPALYPSLDLFVGGNLTLIDPNTLLPVPQELQSLPNILAGQTVTTSFLMKSNVQGYVIACQGLSSSNLSVSVDVQGNQNAACDIANSLPAAFVAPPVNAPPTVLGINPANGQGQVPITDSVVAELTPVSACLVGDTFNNVVTKPIDPNNLNAGSQVVSADLVTQGTFYLEELDASLNAVRHVPVQLSSVGDTVNNTTAATLRLGLGSPLTQYFLKSQTNYRATLLGADAASPSGAVCNASTKAPMAKTFQWTFQSVFTCVNDVAPTATLGQPLNGAVGQAVATPVVVNFSNGINGGTFKVDPSNALNDSFAVFSGATIVGGDVSGGTLVPGAVSLTNSGKTLTFTPSGNLPYSTTVVVRLVNTLGDLCGAPLKTPVSGVQVFSFTTAAAPVAPPAPPTVNPIPTLTNLSAIQVTGSAPAGTSVSIAGGSSTVVVATGSGGLFSVSVPLTPNVKNSLSVTAVDSAKNVSTAVTTDTGGNALAVVSDLIAPTVTGSSPTNGAGSVPTTAAIAVTFSEAINTATVNSLNVVLTTGGLPVAGTASGSGSGLTFTPSASLKPNTSYTLTLRAGGVSDLAGNTLAGAFALSFTTLASSPSFTLSPATGVQGQTIAVAISGTNLNSPVISVSGTGVTATLLAGGTSTSQSASFVIASTAAIGAHTVTIATSGGSATAIFTVTGALPTITSLSPATGVQGQTVPVTITGTNLTGASIAISGTGVTATLSGGGTATSQSATLVISSTAVTGAYTVTLTTLAGTATSTFTVTGALPAITSITPATGAQGQTVLVTILGSNLTSPSISVSGTGVTATLAGGGSATSQSASFVIATTAAPGARTVTVATAAGSVTATFTVTALVPTFTLSPATGIQGQTVPVAITGTNLTGASIAVSGTGVTATLAGGGSATSQSATFAIAASAPTGAYTVTITNSSGNSATATFTVTSPAPTITSLTPATAVQGQTVAVTISGTNLISPSISVSGTGVTATLLGGGSGTSQSASFVIAATATTGVHTVTISTASGTATATFNVTAPLPTITSLTPATGAQGQTVPVTITGTNLTNPTSIAVSGTGVTATLSGGGSATSQSASFVIASTATTGAYVVTLTTAAGSATATFTVTGSLPTITSLSPTTGAQGQTVAVTVTGSNLSNPTITVNGSGVAATVLAGGSATSQTATFVIAGNATVGARTVTVTTASGSATASFTVTSGLPTISALTPASGAQGQTVPITITGTNLFTPTISISGTGVTATLSGAGSASSQTATLVIGATAPTGARIVTITTAAGTATATFTVTTPAPTITSLAPAAGEQGRTVTVAITGTNLISPSISVSGTGVTATLIAGGSATAQSATFVIAATAAIGARTVTVSTASGSATATFTVNVAPPLSVSLSPSPLTVSTESTTTLIITLSDVAPTGGQVVKLATTAGLVTLSATSVTIPQNQTTASIVVTSTATTGSDTITASGTGLTAGTDAVQVQARTFSLNAGLVGLSRTAQGLITLNQPAPSTGATIGLSVANTSLVTVSPSSVTIPAGQTTATFTLTGGSGIGTTTLTANGVASGYTTQTATLTVTNLLLNLSSAQTLAFGQASTTYQVQIAPNAAPAGGVVVNLSSSNTAVATVPATVTIPAGAFGANFTVQAGTAATGTSTISASNANFAPTTTTVSVTAALLIAEASKTLSSSQTDSVDFQLTSGGNLYAAPAAGVVVAGSSSDPTCVKLTATAVTVPAGQSFGSLPFAYGTATLPCTATVTVSNALYGVSSIPVTFQAAANLGSVQVQSGSLGVGSGLQSSLSISLTTAAPAGGVTVEVRSANPSALLVAGSATAIGAPAVNLSIPAGSNSATVYLNGVLGKTGNVTVSATTPKYTAGSATVPVLPSVVLIYGAPVNTTPLSAATGFGALTAAVYSTSGTTSNISPQPVNPNTGAVTVTATSSKPSVGALQTGATNAATATAQIGVGSTYSNNGQGTGFTFVPLSNGTTTLSVTAPGFTTAAATNYGYASTDTVTVSGAGMTLSAGQAATSQYGVGVGLETQGSVSLGAPAPTGGATIHVVSSDPSQFVLSPDGGATVGKASIDLPISAGNSSATFYLIGIGTGTTATLSASNAAGYYTAATPVAVTVNPSVVLIYNAPTATTPLSSAVGFGALTAVVYSTNGTTSNIVPQPVSPNTGALTVTAKSSNASVGALQTGATNAATATAQIGVGYTYSNNNQGTGFTFVPLSNGSTTLSVTASGFTTAAATNYGYASTDTVTVSGAGMTLSAGQAATSQYGVGVGLETQGSVSLGAPAPTGGATIHVVSSDPSQFVLSPDGGATVGKASIDLPISAGGSSASFYLIGIGTGTTATLSASNAAGYYTAATAVAVTVNPSVVLIYNAPTTTTPLSGTSSFGALTAVVYSTNGTTSNIVPQPVSPNTGALTVTAKSSNASVGALQTGATNAATATAQIGVGYTYSNNNQGTGFTFVPLSNGSTTLSVTAPSFTTAAATNYGYASANTVTVSGAGMTVSAGQAATGQYGVGVGLETQGSVSLGAPAPTGGATIHVVSSSPSQFVLSPDGGATVGTAAIDVSIAAGNSSATFYLIGIGTGTTATLSASNAAGYYTAATPVAVTVDPSVVLIYNAPTATTPLSGTSSFGALTAVLYSTSGANSNIVPQAVSPNAGALTVTATSSNTSVGALQTGTTNAATATAQIGVGYTYTNNNQGTGFTFVPLSNGSTTLSVTAPGFTTATATNYGYASTDTVSVSNAALSLQNGVQVGSGLQVATTGYLQAANDGGVTIRVASSDATKLLVSPDAVTPGTPFIDIFVNNGTASYGFYVQGVAGATGTVTLTATTSDTSFTTGSTTVMVVEPQLIFYTGLPGSESATSTDSPFEIATYVPGYTYENVAAGNSLVVTLSSSNTAAASLTTSSQSQTSPVTVTIAAGNDLSPGSVSAGGVALHAVGPGTTNVTASAAGTLSAGQAVTLN